MSITVSSGMQLAIVGDLIAHVTSTPYAGALVGNYCGLFLNSVALTKDTVLSDLTEATYTSYARQAVVYGPVFEQSDGSFAVQGGLLQFQPSDDVTPNVAYGYFVADAISSGNLLYAEMFDSPIGLPDAETAVLVAPQFSYDGTDAGSGTIVT